LPFFEHFRPSTAPRALLGAEWERVFAKNLEKGGLQELLKEASLAIPNIEEETDLPSEIAMKAAVPVLEVAGLFEGDAGSLKRIAYAPLDVLLPLHLYIGEPVHPEFFEIFQDIPDASTVPREIRAEWNKLSEMADHLRQCSEVSLDWRHEQERSGAALLDVYRRRLGA